jgi:hypothetical protein
LWGPRNLLQSILTNEVVASKMGEHSTHVLPV